MQPKFLWKTRSSSSTHLVTSWILSGGRSKQYLVWGAGRGTCSEDARWCMVYGMKVYKFQVVHILGDTMAIIKWFWYDWHNMLIVWLGLAAWFLSPYVSSASICLDFVVQLALPCLIPIPPEIYYPIYPEHFQAHHMNTSKLQLINPHSFTIEKHKFHLFKALFKHHWTLQSMGILFEWLDLLILAQKKTWRNHCQEKVVVLLRPGGQYPTKKVFPTKKQP